MIKTFWRLLIPSKNSDGEREREIKALCLPKFKFQISWHAVILNVSNYF